VIPEVRTPIEAKEMIAAFSSSITENENLLSSFESDFAQYIGVPYARCVYSGRVGICLALRALGLQRGDRVIIPAYTSPIVPMVLLSNGLKPVYAPVSSNSFNIDVDELSSFIGRDIKAVVPIHMFGNPCQMDKLTEIAVEKDLVIIEDVAQALGASYRNKKVGSFGDIAIFSFGKGKNITTMGGGMITTRRKDIMEKIDVLVPKQKIARFRDGLFLTEMLLYSMATSPKIYSFSCKLWNQVRSHYSLSERDILKNYTPYQAALGKLLLKRIDDLNAKRIKNAHKVAREIEEISGLSVQESDPLAKPVYLRLMVKCLRGRFARDVLKRMLFKYGFDVPSLDGYCPIEYASSAEYSESERALLLRVKEEITDRVLALPTNPDLSERELDALVWVLRNLEMNV
jgi:perosamine synthetase